MTATATPPTTSAGGQGKHVPITRREADSYLQDRYPHLTRSKREKIAAAVPTVQRNQPDLDVSGWLDRSARSALGRRPVFYRGHGEDRTYANAEAWNRAEWNSGDAR